MVCLIPKFGEDLNTLFFHAAWTMCNWTSDSFSFSCSIVCWIFLFLNITNRCCQGRIQLIDLPLTWFYFINLFSFFSFWIFCFSFPSGFVIRFFSFPLFSVLFRLKFISFDGLNSRCLRFVKSYPVLSLSK